MSFRCIIVDDEPLALDILEDYVRRTPSLRLAGRFTSGTEALRFLEAARRGEADPVDIAFLDIQMPGLGGMEIARTLEGSGVRVIFTTAFEQYALEGFRVDALDYLLKPVSFEEFTRAVEKALRNSSESPLALVVRFEHRRLVVPLDTIIYIEGAEDYVHLHLTGGSVVRTLMTLKGILELLPPGRFVRVHRSYIVGTEHITQIERGRVVLGEIVLPVSDGYRKELSDSVQ